MAWPLPTTQYRYLTKSTTAATRFTMHPTQGVSAGYIRRSHAVRLRHVKTGLWLHGSRNNPVEERVGVNNNGATTTEEHKTAAAMRRQGLGKPSSTSQQKAQVGQRFVGPWVGRLSFPVLTKPAARVCVCVCVCVCVWLVLPRLHRS